MLKSTASASRSNRQLDATAWAVASQLVDIRDETGEFLLDFEEGDAPFDIKGWHNWDWTQGVGLYGLVRMYERGRDPRVKGLIETWFAARATEPAPPRTINTMAPLLALAYLAEWNADTRLHPVLLDWGDWVMTGLPRTEEGGFQHLTVGLESRGQLWDDTLMMTVLPLAKIGLLCGRPDFVEEAKRQFMLHVKYLTDRRTGLWFHGWTFETRDNMSGALWGRGNSWATIAIPDFIELLDLGPEDGLRAFLIETLMAQVEALSRRQRPDGLWPTLLDDPTSYGEASATAGFAYGILKGARLGLLPERFKAVGLRAMEGLLTCIDAAGVVGQVSFGTPVFATLEEYRQVPITPMPYGQAMALLALEELGRSVP